MRCRKHTVPNRMRPTDTTDTGKSHGKGNPLSLSADFSAEIWQVRRMGEASSTVLKGEKKKTCHQQDYLVRLSFRIEGGILSFPDKGILTRNVSDFLKWKRL